MVPKSARVFVCGHRGLVGSSLVRTLEDDGFSNILTRTHAELDLTNQAQTFEFFKDERVEYAYVAAARVGGIIANSTLHADFLYQNLLIARNIHDLSCHPIWPRFVE